jgi:ketosteroid isomerase-like protein
MSRENVEIVERLAPTFNQRDVGGFLDLLAPDVEWVPILAVLEGRVYRGHEEVRQWIEDLATDWEFFEIYYDELQDLGDQVLALGGWRGRGRASGVELGDQPATWLLDLEDGRIVRLQTFTHREEAMAAAGLPGSGETPQRS